MSLNRSLIRTQQAEKTINGILTQIVCTEFSNYVFAVLTQYGKVGTLVSVAPESRANDAAVSPVFSTRVLLGKDEALTHVVAKHLAASAVASPREATGGDTRPVLLGLSLKDSSLDAVRQMKDVLKGMVATTTSSAAARDDPSAGRAEVAAQRRRPDLDESAGERVFGTLDVDVGEDVSEDIGIGADIGVDIREDIGIGADIGVDIGFGADFREDIRVDAEADIGEDMHVDADDGADLIRADLEVDDGPPLQAPPAPLLREPSVGLFT